MLYIVYSVPHIAQSDVAGVRLQVHEEQQDPVPAPGRRQVHLRPVIASPYMTASLRHLTLLRHLTSLRHCVTKLYVTCHAGTHNITGDMKSKVQTSLRLAVY